MKALIARRQRVLRARHVQHSLSVMDVMRARDEATQIENNAQRIARVRSDLFDVTGAMTGANFAARRELASRLETAGRQLDGALYDANRRIGEKEGQQTAAHREKEIAERLRDKAQTALEHWREARVANLPRSRRSMKGSPQ